MSRRCYYCEKKPGTGYNVSHAHNRSHRRWLPNLQKLRALVDGQVKSIRVCTQCIRSGKVTKVPYNHSGTKAGQTAASS